MGTSVETYADLLNRFGRAWERGDTPALVDVFTPQAAFYPSPFDPPATGRDAIRLYWKDIPHEQAEISFRFGEIFVAGPWFATEFRCTFRRRRTGEPIDLRGAIFCETADRLISEMRLYWERRVGTRP